MNVQGSFYVAVLAIVAAGALLGLHDLSSDQFLAVLTGAGIHVSAVTVPRSASSTSAPAAASPPPPAG